MRYRTLGWLVLGGLIALPLAARADYLSSARDSLKKGELKAAQIDLRNAVRADPQNAEAHYWLGRVNFELGDPVASEREAAAALDRGFDPHQVVPLIAQALLAQNKFDELLTRLKPEGKDSALDAAILVSRGYAEVGLRRPADAQKSFAEAEEAAPNAVEPLLADARLAVARADLAGAQTKIDRAIEAQPKSAEALLAKAQLLRLKNDITGAMAVLDELITDQPSVVQARLDRTSLELAAGKNDAAERDLDVVLKGAPGNVQGIYLRAVMEAQSRNYKAADADLDRISNFVGRIQRAFYLQAVVKEQLGQLEQAEEAARKYLARAPNDLAAYKILARIQFAKHRPDMVIETLGKVADSGKADPESYDLLGRAYAAKGRAAEAVVAFQKAQTLAPNDVGVQTRLASVRMGLGEFDTALGDLEHTLQLAPKIPAVGEALFFAALATGDTKKAGDALEKITAAQGQTEIVANLTGLFKLAQIDFPGARKIFADLADKDPEFIPARINLARVEAMMGDKTGAEKILGDILDKAPSSQPALTMLSSSLVQNNKLSDATLLLERAHAAEPAQSRITVSLGDLYIRANQPQKALDLTLAEKGEASLGVSNLTLRAAAYLGLGQRKDARETYALILKQDPNSVVARRQLVALLMEAGNYESARVVITSSIAAAPRNYQLYQDFVMIDLNATGLDAALATADRLMAEDRDYAEIRALRGDIYIAANRIQDAIAAYTDAAAVAPSAVLTSRLSLALLRAGRKDEATAVLSTWLAKYPDDLTITEQLAEINIGLERYDDAATQLERLLKVKPHDSVALNNLAWVYQQKGDDARAQVLARQAYVLSPGVQTADTLGWILTTSGDARSGLMLLRQAVTEAAPDPRILFHYAVALKDTGDRVEAKRNLEIVVAVKGEFKEKTLAQKALDDMSKGT